MKVMHLLQSTNYSGAENVACQIIQMASSISTDMEMVYVSPKGPIEKVLKKKGITYFPLNSFSLSEVDRAVRTINPDIIHAHDFNASVKAARYKMVVSHIHNNASWISKLDPRTFLYALCVHRYKKIIGVSNSIQQEFLFNQLLGKRFVALPNVVEKDKIITLAEKEIIEPFDLLYVGRFAEAKNPLRFLQIVKGVIDQGYDVKAVMLGQGSLYEECESFIKENALTEYVEMKGFNANPYSFMKAAKLLVMPSVYEGFGLVAVESMVLGTPVICTPVGGLVDIVDDSCGQFCDSDEDFIDAITNLIEDNYLWESKSLNCKEKALKFCDTNDYVTILRNIYYGG